MHKMHFPMFINTIDQTRKLLLILKGLCFFIEVVERGLENCKEPWYPYYFVMGSIMLCIEILLSGILKSGNLRQRATGRFSNVL